MVQNLRPHEANKDLRGRSTAATDHNAARAKTPEARVMLAVAELDPEDRDIILLSLWESCPQSSIAEALELSVSSVRSALGRIRRELKRSDTSGARESIKIYLDLKRLRMGGRY